MLPDTYPVTALNLNYCPIAVGLALLVLLVAWFLPKWGVGRWYRGKAHTLKDADVVMPPLEAASTSVFCLEFWLEATVATNVCYIESSEATKVAKNWHFQKITPEVGVHRTSALKE